MNKHKKSLTGLSGFDTIILIKGSNLHCSLRIFATSSIRWKHPVPWKSGETFIAFGKGRWKSFFLPGPLFFGPAQWCDGWKACGILGVLLQCATRRQTEVREKRRMVMELLLPFAGGLGMFIYGMNIMAQGLENAAGSRVRSLLELLTRNKLMGVVLGMVITAVIQSSSATTVMVVGFVNAGIMNLTQAMGVIMGANIGTTVTGWMVSSVEWAKYLNPSMLAPAAILLGVAGMMIAKRSVSREAAKIVVGFGLLFVGITTMADAVAPLKEYPAFVNLFVVLGKNPLLGIAAGAIVTAVIQSSSASVGILQSLAAAGLVPFSTAIYIIMGQNIGTCATAMISGVGAKKNAKTAALMHLLFNLIGTALFSIASILYLNLVDPVWAAGAISQTQISMVHTLFNVATTFLLFPVSGWIIALAKKLSRADEAVQDEGEVLLDERMLNTPVLALEALNSEIVRMGHVMGDAVTLASRVMIDPKRADIESIHKKEDALDRLAETLAQYAVSLSACTITEQERQSAAHALQILTDMERIGDHCENIAEYAEQILAQKIEFTDTARDELKELSSECEQCCISALDAFVEGENKSVRRAVELETRIDELESALRQQHIQRMTSQQCSVQAGVLFLNALTDMERISDHARNIAEASEQEAEREHRLLAGKSV